MNLLYRATLVLSLVCVSSRAGAGLFSLRVSEPADEMGGIGTLQVLYDPGEENLSFSVGGLDLKISSSTAGVIKFLDAEVINDNDRWDIAVARETTDDEVGELFAASIFSPGLAPGGPQVFAEVKYSLEGSGFTNLILDVAGEDPVYQGDRGDVSSYVQSRGICLGQCDPAAPPTEINLGESWAVFREQMYPQPLPSTPQPAPPTEPPVQVPSIDPPAVTPPTPAPEPSVPPVPDPIDDPVVDTPEGPTDPVIEIPTEPQVIDLPGWPLQSINLVDLINGHGSIIHFPIWNGVELTTQLEPSPFVFIDITQWFTRNGQLSMYDGDVVPMAYTMAFDNGAASLESVASLGSTIPEPHAFVLAAFAGLGILCRRRVA